MENLYVKNSRVHGEFCPLDTTIKILSGRWKTIILNRLIKEDLHFNELARRIPNCTRRMLALQLKELVEAQIVSRSVDELRVSYALTEQGRKLLPIVWAMNDWGTQYIQELGGETELEPSCAGAEKVL